MTKTLPEDFILVEQQQHIKQKLRQIRMVKVCVAWDTYLEENYWYTAEPASDFYNRYPSGFRIK